MAEIILMWEVTGREMGERWDACQIDGRDKQNDDCRFYQK